MISQVNSLGRTALSTSAGQPSVINTVRSGAGSFDFGRAAKCFIDTVRSGAGSFDFGRAAKCFINAVRSGAGSFDFGRATKRHQHGAQRRLFFRLRPCSQFLGCFVLT